VGCGHHPRDGGVSLSTAAFDSFQSPMVSTASNDLFPNKLSIWWIRGALILINFPVVVVALKSPDILQVYLISDLVSASSTSVLVIGLSDACYWRRGLEVVVGGLGGLLTTIGVLLVSQFLQRSTNQQSKSLTSYIGTFVAAPVDGLLWAAGPFAWGFNGFKPNVRDTDWMLLIVLHP